MDAVSNYKLRLVKVSNSDGLACKDTLQANTQFNNDVFVIVQVIRRSYDRWKKYFFILMLIQLF